MNENMTLKEHIADGVREDVWKILGWKPKCTLEELCAMMVKEDLRRNEIGFSF